MNTVAMLASISHELAARVLGINRVLEVVELHPQAALGEQVVLQVIAPHRPGEVYIPAYRLGQVGQQLAALPSTPNSEAL